MTFLPDGSAFFVAEVDTDAKPSVDPVFWNPFNKVVQSHHDGVIDDKKTTIARMARGLPVPWTPELAKQEVRQPPVP